MPFGLDFLPQMTLIFQIFSAPLSIRYFSASLKNMLSRFTQITIRIIFLPTIQDSEPYLQANYAPQKKH